MNKLTTTVLLSGLIIGLSSISLAQMEPQQQPENDTQSQVEAFQVTGDCVMMPSNQTNSESPFMTCQYTRTQSESQMDGQTLFDQMMQRMQQMMDRNQSMQGQGMGGQ